MDARIAFAIITLALAGAPRAARAWDVTGADVAARIRTIQRAQVWTDDDTEDVLARSKQAKRPDWVDRGAWQGAIAGRPHAFGVGSASGPGPSPARRVKLSRESAVAAILKTGPGGKASLAKAYPLDWYLDTATDTLYTLVCGRFAAPRAPATDDWEPSLPEVEARIARLGEAWVGMNAQEAAKDKLRRARRKRTKKPSWLGTPFWTEGGNGRTCSFGVGSAPGRPSAAVLLVAEDKARAGLLGADGPSDEQPLAPAVVDWYYDKGTRTLHALAAGLR